MLAVCAFGHLKGKEQNYNLQEEHCTYIKAIQESQVNLFMTSRVVKANLSTRYYIRKTIKIGM
jgi:hypothetical protein